MRIKRLLLIGCILSIPFSKGMIANAEESNSVVSEIVNEYSDGESKGKFGNKRLMVYSTDVSEDYGAIEHEVVWGDTTLLQYNSVNETREAYNRLSKRYSVYIDENLEVTTTSEESIKRDSGFYLMNLEGLYEKATKGNTVGVAILDTGWNTQLWSDSRVEDVVDSSGQNEDYLDNHGTTVGEVVLGSTPSNKKIYPYKVMSGYK